MHERCEALLSSYYPLGPCTISAIFKVAKVIISRVFVARVLFFVIVLVSIQSEVRTFSLMLIRLIIAVRIFVISQKDT